MWLSALPGRASRPRTTEWGFSGDKLHPQQNSPQQAASKLGNTCLSWPSKGPGPPLALTRGLTGQGASLSQPPPARQPWADRLLAWLPAPASLCPAETHTHMLQSGTAVSAGFTRPGAYQRGPEGPWLSLAGNQCCRVQNISIRPASLGCRPGHSPCNIPSSHSPSWSLSKDMSFPHSLIQTLPHCPRKPQCMSPAFCCGPPAHCITLHLLAAKAKGWGRSAHALAA